MGFLYPSDEWIKELQKICNNDPEFAAVAGKFSAKMMHEIEAEPGKLKNTVLLYLWPNNGKVTEAKVLSALDEAPPDIDYIMSGKYSAWKAVVNGKMDPFRAMATNKIKVVKGSQLTLMKQAKAAMKLMNSCKAVESRFMDEEAT